MFWACGAKSNNKAQSCLRQASVSVLLFVFQHINKSINTELALGRLITLQNLVGLCWVWQDPGVSVKWDVTAVSGTNCWDPCGAFSPSDQCLRIRKNYRWTHISDQIAARPKMIKKRKNAGKTQGLDSYHCLTTTMYFPTSNTFRQLNPLFIWVTVEEGAAETSHKARNQQAFPKTVPCTWWCSLPHRARIQQVLRRSSTSTHRKLMALPSQPHTATGTVT